MKRPGADVGVMWFRTRIQPSVPNCVIGISIYGISIKGTDGVCGSVAGIPIRPLGERQLTVTTG